MGEKIIIKTFFVFPLLSLSSGLREERYHFSLSLSASNLEETNVALLLRRKTFIYHEGNWIFEISEFCINLLIFVSCRITFPETSSSSKKRKHDEDEPKEVNQELLVEPFVVANRGPYPFNQPKK